MSPRIQFTPGASAAGWATRPILLDTTRLRALGWAPTRSIEESIVETLAFLEASPFVNDRQQAAEGPRR